MNKIFNKFLVGLLFVLGVIIVPTYKVEAAITVTIKANPSTVAYGGVSTISWTSTGATSCSESGGRGGTGTTGSFDVSSLLASTTFTVTCSKDAYCSGTYVEEADWDGNTWDGNIVGSVLKNYAYWGWMPGYVYGEAHCGYCSDNGKTGYRVTGSGWYNTTCNKWGWPWCRGSSWSGDNGYIGSAYVTRDCSAFSGSRGLCEGLCYWDWGSSSCRGGGSCNSQLTTSSCYNYPYYSKSCTWNP